MNPFARIANRSGSRSQPAAEEGAGNQRSFLQYGAALAVVAMLLGGAAYLFMDHDDQPPPHLVRELTIVNVVPPPPPPPPPQKLPEQKMIEQPKMAEQEFKEDKPVEKPKDEPVKDAKKNDEPPGPLSLDAKATGPGDLFNLGSKPGGNPYGGGGGSRWGWYASIVQSQIESALRANDRTRNAVMQIQVRLWADASGHVSRVQLVSSTGDPALDAVIRNDVLGSLVLREPPPKDMPMPLVARLSARHPI